MIARLVSLATLVILLCAGPASAQNESESAAKDEHAKTEAKAGADEHGAKGEKAHASEHLDPHDLSHANASKELTDPAAFKADASIFTFVIFLLLLAILVKFAWGPISRGLEAREKGIADKIEQARIAAEQATAQLAQYEAKLAAATAEAQQIVAKARQDADVAGQRLIAEAQSAASKERERAVADIGVAKNQALREIAEKSVDTAIGLARNIIRREVRPGDHEQLIQDALKQFPSSSLN
ncbi:MAG TPA: F0F1 ATP synthase subunit B [Pirellulaceae bacterium]|nr:F0F1 ATP synthase subunit B [Pirellulaceae bacterium]